METATLASAAAVPSSSAAFSSSFSASLSSSERHFLSNGVVCDLRSDGRSRLDYRYFQLRSSVVPQAAGSARMRLEGTDVIVAVTADITPTDWSQPDEGLLLCSVELAACCLPPLTAGSSALSLQTELKAALEALFVRSGAVDRRQLCLLRGEQCWTLYIDALVLASDGSLIDAAALATKAALLDCRLPAVALSRTSSGGGTDSSQPVEVTLTDEPPTRLQLTERLPVAVTLHSFHHSTHFVLDARADEEEAAEWRLTVGVAEDGRIVSVEKGGRRAGSQTMIRRMVSAARKVGVDLNRVVRKLTLSDDGSGSSGRVNMHIQ